MLKYVDDMVVKSKSGHWHVEDLIEVFDEHLLKT